MAHVEGTEIVLQTPKCPVGVCVKNLLFYSYFSKFSPVALVARTEISL